MIEVRNLVKTYDSYTALSDVSFDVEEGEIFGFLGPNGAGKSTTMNIMTGYLAPTKGSVKIDGFDIVTNPMEAKKRIGYLPELPPLYPDMTPNEYLKFIAEAKDITKADRKDAIERVMEKTGITDVRNQVIKTLSKGYRQRVGMALALIGEPKLIILDEPTVGLDAVQIKEFRNLIMSLKKDHTVILSSHILSEVSEICGKIMIIRKGKLLAIDTPEALAERIGDKAKKLTLEEIFIKILKEDDKGNPDNE